MPGMIVFRTLWLRKNCLFWLRFKGRKYSTPADRAKIVIIAADHPQIIQNETTERNDKMTTRIERP